MDRDTRLRHLSLTLKETGLVFSIYLTISSCNLPHLPYTPVFTPSLTERSLLCNHQAIEAPLFRLKFT